MTPEQELARADRAKEVLENEVFIEAFAAIRKELIEQWEQSPARDEKGRELLWLMLKQADKFKLALVGTMEAGKLAKASLQHQQTKAEQAKAWKA